MKVTSLYTLFAIMLLSASLCRAETREEAASAEDPAGEELSAEEQKYVEWARDLWASIKPQTGEVKLPGDIATLKLGEKFYYLSPEDAEKVLVEVWGNPPGGNTYGMLFPTGSTPFDQNSWAVTIDYEEEGYVSDEDAAEINYDELLQDMQHDTSEYSKQRVKDGYPAIRLLGWAERPHYDAASKKLYWAKELKFGDDEQNTLNYNIRVLGRKGVLVMNFIANMSQLQEINGNLEPVLAMTDFNPGFRYQDFNPGIDKVAAYGIGALVAGKVLAKTGAIAAVLLALKKLWILVFAGVYGFIKALFRKKPAPTTGGQGG
ncbi:MAG TPA: DUF2167 domain-containing protein [Gammaproteobacteria bacterium]|nr:DUF2167 domain-containing protein [Gammaproteobacteria bacterium]